MPLLVGVLLDRPLGADAGVVDEDVEAAERVGRALDGAGDTRRVVGDVGTNRRCEPRLRGRSTRSSTATRAPRSRSSRAVARPIPEAPPVTSAASPPSSSAAPDQLLRPDRRATPAPSGKANSVDESSCISVEAPRVGRRPVAAVDHDGRGDEVLVQVVDPLDPRAARSSPRARRSRTSRGAGRARRGRRRRRAGTRAHRTWRRAAGWRCSR